MLAQLDRYLVGRFARVLGFAILSFIVIYIVVDLIDHLEDFLIREVPPADIARYYVNYAPYIVVLTLPIGMLLATLFVIGGMGSANELVAIKAAGISMWRVAWPLLRFAFLVSIVALILAELVVPRSNDVRVGILDVRKDAPAGGFARHLARQDRGGLTVYAGTYDANDESARNVTIVAVRDDQPVRRIDAEEMRWDPEGWLLINVSDRVLHDGGQRLTTYGQLRMSEILLRPADLARVDKLPEQMAFLDLADYIRRVRRGGGDASRWLVDLHLKIAFPLASFMMVWLGFPLAARQWRGGKALYIGLTLLIGFLFFVIVRAGQALGRSGDVDPILAAWAGDGLFLVLGFMLFLWTRK